MKTFVCLVSFSRCFTFFAAIIIYIVFTCTVCDTRSAKQFTENSYKNGVVVVQCPGCNSKHLIADNLGMFSDQEEGGWNIEKGMEKLGRQDNIKVVNDVLELSVEDVWGHDPYQQQEKEPSTKMTEGDNQEIEKK